MRKRVQIVLAVVFAAIVALIAWQVLSEREPVYKGKPVTVWIHEGSLRSKSGRSAQEANEAVMAAGIKGLPYYVRLLETPGDLPLKTKVIDWINTKPRLQLDFSSSETSSRRTIGAYGLSILGAEAKPAIPALTALLTNGDEEQVSLVANTLAHLGLEGVEPLTNALMNPKANWRLTSALALGLYARQNGRWPQLKPKTPEEVESAARIIVPILISCLNDADTDVQAASIHSLGWFAREPETIIPILIDRAQNATNVIWVRRAALEALGNYGTRAKSAAPVLLQCFQNQGSEIRSFTARALRLIDPEAAAKAGVK
jgi:HEAT repeat protein